MVVNLFITNVTAGYLVCFSIDPDLKYSIISSINLESLSCCGTPAKAALIVQQILH